MNPTFGAFQASQTVKRMQRLTGQVTTFAAHARTLRTSPAIDGRVLLEEANGLVKHLIENRTDFENLQMAARRLSRSLPSKPGESNSALQWGHEFRAGAKQFMKAVLSAENEIRGLYAAADAQMSGATRTPTAPENVFDALLLIADVLVKWIEFQKKRKH